MQNKTIYLSLVNGDNALIKRVNNYTDKLIVFFSLQNKQFYLVFMDYIEFTDFIINIYEKFRCYHEVIFDINQKMRFDIDSDNLELDIETLINQIVDGCIDYLKKFSIKLNPSRDVVITSSSGKEKISYHIIIDNYCVKDHYNAYLFYKFVVSKVDKKYKQYIDKAVYKSLQNFRILYNKKFESNRVKKMVYEWKYKGETIKYTYKFQPKNLFQKVLLELSATLITETSGCKMIPYKSSPLDKKLNIEEISDNRFKIIQDKLKELSLTQYYQILNVVDNVVCLKRIKPSYCQICKRKHEHENPYIKVVKDRCEFYCRRSDKPLILFNFATVEKFLPDNLDKEEMLKKSYINCVLTNK